MVPEKGKKPQKKPFDLPSAEKVVEELGKAESMDDFFGRDGCPGYISYPSLFFQSKSPLART